MIYRFGTFRLDTDTCELSGEGGAVAVEPQVLALIRLLIENRDRLVSRDEIVEQVWNGRIVSEAAISSRIKSARQALGDDGGRQTVIRTVPKLGFRFVAEVETVRRPEPAAAAPRTAIASDVVVPEAERPSIAVLPFSATGTAGPRAWIAEALPQDLITALSRLRWLFVIARGSSFQFRGEQASLERVRAALRVRYCLSGAVEIDGAAMAITVELCDTRDGGVVWSERFQGRIETVHEVREAVVQSVIAALELQIPLAEARRARLSAPESLDAWSAYHLGLHHMFRFSREGTARAMALFEQAAALEPSFARAQAGLSFAHFETAFLRFTEDAARSAALARRFAEQSLERDELDPFCNLMMGRAFWLTGELEASLPWIDRAVRLNPNYAQGKYSRAWSEVVLGEAAPARSHVDAALALSPLDPLAYAMLGVRAFCHLAADEPAVAAEWGERAARSPGAHPLIEMIAAICQEANGEDARAQAWAASARRRNPSLTGSSFFQAFPMRDAAMRRRVEESLARLGMAP